MIWNVTKKKWIKIERALTSISLSINKSSTISALEYWTAKCNGESFKTMYINFIKKNEFG